MVHLKENGDIEFHSEHHDLQFHGADCWVWANVFHFVVAGLVADLVAAAADVALLAQPGRDPATANRTRRTPTNEHNQDVNHNRYFNQTSLF